MLLDIFFTLFSSYLTSVGSARMLFITHEQTISQKVRRMFPTLKVKWRDLWILSFINGWVKGRLQSYSSLHT